MLDDIPLPKGFFDFEIGLSRGGAPEGLDENAYRAARLMHRSFHGEIVLIHIKYTRLRPWLNIFAGNGMIRLRRTCRAGKEGAGENNG